MDLTSRDDKGITHVVATATFYANWEVEEPIFTDDSQGMTTSITCNGVPMYTLTREGDHWYLFDQNDSLLVDCKSLDGISAGLAQVKSQRTAAE